MKIVQYTYTNNQVSLDYRKEFYRFYNLDAYQDEIEESESINCWGYTGEEDEDWLQVGDF